MAALLGCRQVRPVPALASPAAERSWGRARNPDASFLRAACVPAPHQAVRSPS